MKPTLTLINATVLALLVIIAFLLRQHPLALAVIGIMGIPLGFARWALRPDASSWTKTVAGFSNAASALFSSILLIGVLLEGNSPPDSRGIGIAIVGVAALWLLLSGFNTFHFSRHLVLPGLNKPKSPAAPVSTTSPTDTGNQTPIEAWLHRIGMQRLYPNFLQRKVGIGDLDAMTLSILEEITGDMDDARTILDEIMKGSHVSES